MTIKLKFCYWIWTMVSMWRLEPVNQSPKYPNCPTCCFAIGRILSSLFSPSPLNITPTLDNISCNLSLIVFVHVTDWKQLRILCLSCLLIVMYKIFSTSRWDTKQWWHSVWKPDFQVQEKIDEDCVSVWDPPLNPNLGPSWLFSIFSCAHVLYHQAVWKWCRGLRVFPE